MGSYLCAVSNIVEERWSEAAEIEIGKNRQRLFMSSFSSLSLAFSAQLPFWSCFLKTLVAVHTEYVVFVFFLEFLFFISISTTQFFYFSCLFKHEKYVFIYFSIFLFIYFSLQF